MTIILLSKQKLAQCQLVVIIRFPVLSLIGATPLGSLPDYEAFFRSGRCSILVTSHSQDHFIERSDLGNAKLNSLTI